MKNFLDKLKVEIKFRKAGEGHSLTENKILSNSASTSRSSGVPAQRAVPTASSQRAGEAALLRLSQQEKESCKKPQSATATWKHDSAARSTDRGGSSTLEYGRLRKEVKQEMVAERTQSAEFQSALTLSQHATRFEIHEPLLYLTASGALSFEEDGSVGLSVDGIYFKCPLCPVTMLQREKNAHLRECLENLYTQNPHSAAASMIQSLNKDKEKVKACIDILCKYIDNICNNPGEEKFRKIKQSNRIYKERVSPITGAVEFILACGFEDKELEQEDKSEHFYVLSSELDEDALQTYKAILLSAEPLKPTLDRNIKVFRPTSSGMKFELPEEFFSLSSDEIKREYHSKLEEIDKQSQLRTKAMREADKKQNKMYQFTLIRVRFPDGVILQGTFYSRETLCDLFEFVRKSLESDWQPFVLSEPTGQLREEEITLNDSGLVPAAVVIFAWDANIMADIIAASGTVQQGDYLKPDLMASIQELS